MSEIRQLTLDDAAAQAAKAEGIGQVWSHTPAEWRGVARAYVLAMLLKRHDGAEVTPDEIRACVPFEPHHPNVWGGFTSQLIKAGWISYAGRQHRSAQPRGHGNKNEVYVINRHALEQEHQRAA